MKNALAPYLLALLSFLFITEVSAQDPQYSQFYSNLTMLNPSFTGSGKGPRIAMNYRQQWVSIPGHYKQFAFSYDNPVYIGETTHGLGITFASDVAGEGSLSRLDVTGNYAYQLDISDEHTIRLGVAAGIQQASVDFLKLRFPDQIDPRDGFVFNTQEPFANALQNPIRVDAHAGVSYFNEYAWLGFTVNHLVEPRQFFYELNNTEDAKLPRKYTLTGGLRIPAGGYNDPEAMNITPAFLLKMQGEFIQVDAGLYVNVEPMVFGVWYRHQDAMIGLIGFQKDNFSFGYSYDYTISRLTQGASGGSHELALKLEFEQYRKRRFKHKDLPCPRF